MLFAPSILSFVAEAASWKGRAPERWVHPHPGDIYCARSLLPATVVDSFDGATESPT